MNKPYISLLCVLGSICVVGHSSLSVQAQEKNDDAKILDFQISRLEYLIEKRADRVAKQLLTEGRYGFDQVWTRTITHEIAEYANISRQQIREINKLYDPVVKKLRKSLIKKGNQYITKQSLSSSLLKLPKNEWTKFFDLRDELVDDVEHKIKTDILSREQRLRARNFLVFLDRNRSIRYRAVNKLISLSSKAKQEIEKEYKASLKERTIQFRRTFPTSIGKSATKGSEAENKLIIELARSEFLKKNNEAVETNLTKTQLSKLDRIKRKVERELRTHKDREKD